MSRGAMVKPGASPFNHGVADAVKNEPCNSGKFVGWYDTTQYLSGYICGMEKAFKYKLRSDAE